MLACSGVGGTGTVGESQKSHLLSSRSTLASGKGKGSVDVLLVEPLLFSLRKTLCCEGHSVEGALPALMEKTTEQAHALPSEIFSHVRTLVPPHTAGSPHASRSTLCPFRQIFACIGDAVATLATVK